MMENLFPEVWTTDLTADPYERHRTIYRPEDEREAGPPRAGEVLREIAFLLVVHAVVAMIVLSILKATGVH